MGAGASVADLKDQFDLDAELAKPLDGSDIDSLDTAKAEVARIRRMLKEYQAKSEAGRAKEGRIVCCVDGGELSEKAFKVACAIRPANAHVSVISVLDPAAEAKEEAKQYLSQHVIAKYESDLRPEIDEALYETLILEKKGDVKSTICNYINSEEMQPVSFVAFGMHGIKKRADKVSSLGSNIDLSMRSAKCAALIVKDNSADISGPCKWVCAVDGSERAQNCFTMATYMAGKRDGDKVVPLWVVDDSAQNLEKMYKRMKAEYPGLKTVDRDRNTPIGQQIIDAASAENVGILCFGADGMASFEKHKDRKVLGSVSDFLVKKAECNCLVQSQQLELELGISGVGK